MAEYLIPVHLKEDAHNTQTKVYFSFLSIRIVFCRADFRTWFPYKRRLRSLSLTLDWQNFFGAIMSVLICWNLICFFFKFFFLFFSLLLHLPTEQFHEVLEAVLSEEVEGALGRAEVDEKEDEQDNGQKWDEEVPAGCQDVVPLGLVWTLLGHLQVPLSLLVPGLHRHIQTHSHFSTCSHWRKQQSGFKTASRRKKLRLSLIHIHEEPKCLANVYTDVYCKLWEEKGNKGVS